MGQPLTAGSEGVCHVTNRKKTVFDQKIARGTVPLCRDANPRRRTRTEEASPHAFQYPAAAARRRGIPGNSGCLSAGGNPAQGRDRHRGSAAGAGGPVSLARGYHHAEMWGDCQCGQQHSSGLFCTLSRLYRQRDSHLFRHSASGGVRADHGAAGPPGRNRRCENHTGV